MIAANPTVQAVTPDGVVLPWWSDHARMRALLQRFAPADCERFLSLEGRLARARAPPRAAVHAGAARPAAQRASRAFASCSGFALEFRGLRGREIRGPRRFRDRQPRRIPRPLARLAAPQVADTREQPLRQARRALRPGHAVRPAVSPARRRRGVEAGFRRPRHGRHGRHHAGDGRGVPRRGRRDPHDVAGRSA